MKKPRSRDRTSTRDPGASAESLFTQPHRRAVLNERLLGSGGYHSLITDRYTYVEYKTGETELYDRQNDPYQLRSIHSTASPALLDRLRTRLVSLKACAGQSCRTGEDPP